MGMMSMKARRDFSTHSGFLGEKGGGVQKKYELLQCKMAENKTDDNFFEVSKAFNPSVLSKRLYTNQVTLVPLINQLSKKKAILPTAKISPL